ncbi:MAG TPA: TonB-dependent receptor [Solimonas sp.]
MCPAWAQQAPPEDVDFLDALIAEQDGSSAVTPAQQPETQQPPADLEVIPVKPGESEPLPTMAEARRAPQVEEIVVTATKRAEPLREIPATIAVLTGEDLEREGIQNIEQIVTMVPGVNLSDEGTGGAPKRVTIRGVSSGTNTNLSVGTLIGDIPFSDPFSPKVQLDPNPFDMATVEVLKGPQGTLFGGTGLNGMIRYVPEAPRLDEVQVKYYGQLTSYPGNGGSGWNYGAMFNAPFADNQAAIRLVGFKRDSPGYVDDTKNDRHDINTASQYGLRGILAWQPDDRWKISLLGATQRTEENDIAYADNYDGRLAHGDSPRPSPSKSAYNLANLSVERSFDWGEVISQTSYVEKQFEIFLEASRALGGLLPLLAGATDNHSEGITQELRLVSAPGDGPWKWLLGAFYYDMQLYDCSEIGALQGLPTLPRLPLLSGVLATPCPGNASKIAGMLDIGQLRGEVDLEEHALFGELTRALGDRWEVTLGARAYRIRTGGTINFSGLLYASQNQLRAGQKPADSSEDGISPKASIAFQATDNLRLYFTASRGFRFGGPQLAASSPTTDVPETYKSDSLWNYELGLRSDWLDRSLRIDASVYRIDWKDPQVYQISADGLTGFIDNVGGARGHGVELSLSYLPSFLEGLSLNATAAWGRTVTTEEFKAANDDPVAVGSPWPMSPRWQTSTTLAYAQPVASWQLGASLRHNYLGQACNTILCTAQVFGYRTLDLNLFATPASGSYWPQLSLTLANLTDERGYGNITTNPLPARDTVTYIAPRTLVLRLSGNF